MKFAICNLGCKVNNFEANWYQQQLSLKYEEVDFKEYADIYVINSCTVTNMAGSKTRQMIHKARKQNPNAVIVAVSCYVQMEHNNENIFSDVDILIGSKDKTKLPELVEQFLITRKKINIVEDFRNTNFEEMFITNFNQTRAYLKIQDGCNQFCSYCTIPYARGSERCLNHRAVLKQAKQLVDNGYIELVLTGIHTGRYNDGEVNLTQLIKLLLSEIKGIERIRLSSIELTEITDELIDLIATDKRVANHLHIPLQVGNDRLLKLNNRPYNQQTYYERIEYIRSKCKDISISCDVIVGLPTETDEEFEDTRNFIEKCKLSFCHVFPYARKKGTKDYDLKQVEEIKKKTRMQCLVSLSKNLYKKYRDKFVGKVVDVVFETNEQNCYTGHCSEYIVVKCESTINLKGKMIAVKILKNTDDCLQGEVYYEN